MMRPDRYAGQAEWYDAAHRLSASTHGATLAGLIAEVSGPCLDQICGPGYLRPASLTSGVGTQDAKLVALGVT